MDSGIKILLRKRILTPLYLLSFCAQIIFVLFLFHISIKYTNAIYFPLFPVLIVIFAHGCFEIIAQIVDNKLYISDVYITTDEIIFSIKQKNNIVKIVNLKKSNLLNLNMQVEIKPTTPFRLEQYEIKYKIVAEVLNNKGEQATKKLEITQIQTDYDGIYKLMDEFKFMQNCDLNYLSISPKIQEKLEFYDKYQEKISPQWTNNDFASLETTRKFSVRCISIGILLFLCGFLLLKFSNYPASFSKNTFISKYEIQMNKIDNLIAQKEYDLALSELENAEKIDEDFCNTNIRYTKIYLGKNNVLSAAKHIQENIDNKDICYKLPEKKFELMFAYELLAIHHIRTYNYNKAKETYEESINILTDMPNIAYAKRGLLYCVFENDYNKAQSDFDTFKQKYAQEKERNNNFSQYSAAIQIYYNESVQACNEYIEHQNQP